ncbi:MAG: hypothetical protein L6E13_07565 [Firmicutes bacterium]|nr:hypothetical protein [Bacillota bacterium]
MTEVVIEIRGLDSLTCCAHLHALGGRQATPRRMAGRGWTAVIRDDPIRAGPYTLERVLLHILGAPGPVNRLVRSLEELAGAL